MITNLRAPWGAMVATILLALTAPAMGQSVINPRGYGPVWSAGGQGSGTTNSFAVASSFTQTPGVTPVVQYLQCTSDLATSKVQFFTLSNQVAVLSIGSGYVIVGGTNTAGSGATNFAGNDCVLCRHVSNDTFERLAVSTTTNATGALTWITAPSVAIAAGDTLWKAAKVGYLGVGAATNSVFSNDQTVFAGQAGLPLLMEITGTAGCSINVASGIYR